MDTIEDHRAQQESLKASEKHSTLEATHEGIRRHLGALLFAELHQREQDKRREDDSESST